MKFVDFIAKIFFGNFKEEGYYKANDEQKTDSYTFTSVFPNKTIENRILKTK